MHLLRGLILSFVALLVFAGSAIAADRAIIILDASGSMWAQIDGKSRIEIARETLNTVLKGVPDSLELGFMAYGHRQKNSCADIELLVPPAAGTAAEISQAAAGISPKGMTPLSAAVKQAAELLKYTENKATVILITDGLETCNADPCALATELEQTGIDFTVDVVGLGLTAKEGKQVACLADNTGGKYFQASDAKGLTDALTQTVAAVSQPAATPAPAPAPAAPTPPPVDTTKNFAPDLFMVEGGPLVQTGGNSWEIYAAKADGTKSDSPLETDYGSPFAFKLDPGNYIVKANLGEAWTEQPVTIVAGQVAKPVFVLNAGTLVMHPKAFDGGDVVAGIGILTEYPGGHVSNYGDSTIVVPAGDEKVTATLDAGELVVDIPLAAGQTVEKDLIVGVGHVVANALYSEGGDKITDGELTFHFEKAKKHIDGTRDDVGTAYGPDTKRDLPPGDYVVTITADQAQVEVPFTVKAGGENDITVPLNAGIAAISAPGAQKIEVFGAKKDIKGNRPGLSYAYAQKLETTLPTGDYVAVATMDDASTTKEAPFTVTAGKRTETSVP
jgi:Ca-activated chloride channel family protein